MKNSRTSKADAQPSNPVNREVVNAILERRLDFHGNFFAAPCAVDSGLPRFHDLDLSSGLESDVRRMPR